jgi:hypothetical protein
LVHPNTPEAEHLAINLQKHAAGFLKHYLLDIGANEGFVQDFLKETMDPALVHDADNCKWDEETLTIITEAEQEEEVAAGKLINQSWFKDIVEQYEEQHQSTSRKSKNYASAAALYNLDATRSVKTTHEANDGATVGDELEVDAAPKKNNSVEFEDDISSIGDGGAQEAGGSGKKVEESDSLGEEPEEDDAVFEGSQKGHTPKSGFVWRETDGKIDGADEFSDDEDSSVEDVTPKHATATASAAGNHELLSAGRGG